MSSESKIQWTDASWSPITGCTRVSPGCQSCYAEQLTATRLAHLPKYAGLAVIQDGDARWTNEIRCHEEELAVPLHWKKPRMIFVNSMSDTFHPKVPFPFIANMMTTMAQANQHTYQILTKRPENAAKFFDWFLGDIHSPAMMRDWRESWGNVWIGTSLENQRAADERIPHLLRCSAAVRFLSVEPMLEAVDLSSSLGVYTCYGCGYRGFDNDHTRDADEDACPECGTMRGEGFGDAENDPACRDEPKIYWVIAGCESGTDRRECKLEWVRDLRDQCKAAGLAFFVKQLSINGRVEHDLDKFPEDLRIREFPLGSQG